MALVVKKTKKIQRIWPSYWIEQEVAT